MARHYAIVGALFLMAIAAADSIMGLAYRNGWLYQNSAYLEAKPRLLPGTGDVNMRTTYTGIAFLDEWIIGLLIVFWPVASGNYPPLSLFAVYMAGQCLATHTLVVLEGIRPGNKGKIISYSSIWGIIYQSIPWGVIKPLYWMVYLLTSPLTNLSSFPTSARAKAILPADSQLRALPFSVMLGFGIPTLLAALPSPSVITIDQKQVFLASWQAFPMYVGVFQPLIAFSIKRYSHCSPYVSERRLRTVYLITIFLTSTIHALTVALATFPSLWTALLRFADGTITLRNVFVPQSPFSSTLAPTFADGCLTLLKYDMYYACAATLLWAITSLSSVDRSSYLKKGAQGTALVLLCGPGGAALATIWNRDEIMLRGRTLKERSN